MDYLSRRGHSNVVETMAQLPKAMLESNDDDTDVRGYQEPIDLSVAENWLIREEVLGIGVQMAMISTVVIDPPPGRSCCTIKALILTNPHNPLGQCYPERVLEECLRFCQRRNIHLISEEIFALSTFNPSRVDLPEPRRFVSMLAVDPTALGCDPGRVHVVWSMSKDFAAAGIKLGCTVTQANPALRDGLAMATSMNVSTLSTVFASALLSSESLPALVKLNSVRLAEAYDTLTSFFDRHGIYYIPCNAGHFVLAKLAPQASSGDDEAALIIRLGEAGVLVSPGRAYHVGESGWARVSFAVERATLKEAIRRMKCVLPWAPNLLPGKRPGNDGNGCATSNVERLH
ncbi:MAG: hypothetical protein ASARMPRED_005950 [Alectoria sarmentosa]|nr:MAG: hypothetical protein ASARMPRED_005950 [Alectoria sarmentosa]